MTKNDSDQMGQVYLNFNLDQMGQVYLNFNLDKF